MSFLTTGTILKMSLELTLGVCMKLWCDNGRIHYSDFVNDFLFWLPGVDAVDSDGLTRQVMATSPTLEVETEMVPTRMAAK